MNIDDEEAEKVRTLTSPRTNVVKFDIDGREVGVRKMLGVTVQLPLSIQSG